jgi:hypothetical protein
MIDRIDKNTDASVENIRKGKQNLIEVLQSYSSNTAIVVKCIIVIFIFLMIYIFLFV